MNTHKNYVLLDLDLRKFNGHKESVNDWFLINTPSNTSLQNSSKEYSQMKNIQEFLCQSTKFTKSICKNSMGTLQISTSNNFENTDPV